MDPRKILMDDFVYPLPDHLVAHNPKKERDSSRLLICDDTIHEDIFSHLPQYLPSRSLMVFNNTRVVEARLLFRKPTGAAIEIFCLEPDNLYPDITSAYAHKKEVYWKCLVGNASSWSTGLTLEKIEGDITLQAKLISKEKDHFIIQLSWVPEELSFAEVLHQTGVVPLPPYIKRTATAEDAENYQTIFAEQSGSVAAPTAGLHFTPAVMEKLFSAGITKKYLTLHVGAGTFKPVKEEISDHEMHAEFFEVDISLIDSLLENKIVIAVGTTSLRTLESLYWLGSRLINDPSTSLSELKVTQWEPYDNDSTYTVAESLGAIKNWMIKNNRHTLVAKTSLLIVPSYIFRIVSILVTNFHQPRSTLLLLVAAFAGPKWKSAYTYALENEFRFLSYGDSCLFFRQEPPYEDREVQ